MLLSKHLLFCIYVYTHFLCLQSFDRGEKKTTFNNVHFFFRIKLLLLISFYQKKSQLKTKRQEFVL